MTAKNATLSALLKQQQTLEKQIAEIRAQEKAGALDQIRALMSDYSITTLEIEGRKRPFKPRGPRKPKTEQSTA